MEEERNEIVNLLLHGCSLARDLEANLQNLPAGNHAMMISHRCDEIIGVFVQARNQLSSLNPTPPAHHQQGKGKEVAESSVRAVDGGGPELLRSEAGGSLTSPRQRNPRRSTRNDDQGKAERRTIRRVSAALIGNTEVPPEDGFTWRKYGQKEILNANYPRSYYRCTHQKLYGCPAKKQVQRLNSDPSTFEIVYRGEHTCHMSATAPSIPPPTSDPGMMILAHHDQISAVHHPQLPWIPLDISRQSGEGGSSIFTHQQELSSILGSTNAPAGPSAVGSHHDQRRDGVDFLNQNPVLDDHFDLGDLPDHMMMFNSGSNGSNGMEVMFPPSDDKWDQPEDRKD
ncbi:hypothetical protein Cgig2_032834 [Carnegiea gigantea]|uniref:WRKY domain-containing protein n=1 Tax=Carnegiea gigantea TaxID=171969 RepID=A0A9Q1GX55_9CARY|nr:hypothetical protein Cgig2_032834 [Carnegiea gigantea]